MFLIFTIILRFIYLLECTPRILHGFTRSRQKKPPISNGKIGRKYYIGDPKRQSRHYGGIVIRRSANTAGSQVWVQEPSSFLLRCLQIVIIRTERRRVVSVSRE